MISILPVAVAFLAKKCLFETPSILVEVYVMIVFWYGVLGCAYQVRHQMSKFCPTVALQ